MSDFPTPPERDPLVDHLHVARELLEKETTPTEAPMGWRLKLAVILFVLWLAGMAYTHRGEDRDGPEWSGVSRVGGDR